MHVGHLILGHIHVLLTLKVEDPENTCFADTMHSVGFTWFGRHCLASSGSKLWYDIWYVVLPWNLTVGFWYSLSALNGSILVAVLKCKNGK